MPLPKTTLSREIRRALYGVVFAVIGFVIATELLFPGQPLSLNRGALPFAIVGGLVGGFGVDWLLLPWLKKRKASKPQP